MRRMRLLLALVALAMAVPVSLLVHRASSSAKAEERAQRQTLADTAFAAVEGELAALLEREESRAWDEWRHLRVPEGEVAGSEGLVRSPLADLPAAAWNRGWFQVEPDGLIATPFLPEEELAAALGLAPASAAARARDHELRDWVLRWLTERPARPSRPAPSAPPLADEESEPGLILGEIFDRRDGGRVLQDARLDAPAASMAGAEAPAPAAPAGKGKKTGADEPAERRRQEQAAPRKAEVFQKQASAEAVQQVARNVGEGKDELVFDSMRQRATPASAEGEVRRSADSADGRSGATRGLSGPDSSAEATELDTALGAEVWRDRVADSFADEDRLGGRLGGRLEERERLAPVDIVVEPFIGELGPAGRLVLHRLVVVGGTTYRQGLLVDVERLAEAVNPLELLARTAGIGGRFSLVPAVSAASEQEAFTRRLPPPFDALRAVLSLEVGEGSRGTRHVLGLAALVALFGLAGFIAVDRMVALRLGYAQRRSDFVSSVTHELKTPLAAIRLHGEMLREGIARTEQKRADSYRTITAECERLSRLVDNVLELSRLEKGTRSVSTALGPLEPVLREAIEILEPHAASAGFRLELDCAPELAARFDRDALVQVVLNLVDNALKYARDAEDRRVSLVARREGERVSLVVRDRGPGVPPRHLRRIFEPFWRGERELTRRTKGTGIGLALVRGLVERMGGEVRAQAAEGGGFEVRIRLRGDRH